MTLREWEELSRQRLLRYKIFDVVEARRRSPRTGRESGFFLVETWDWVNVVAFTTADEVLLVRQYRHGADEFTLEIPGGVITPGEDAVVAAGRELREETGFAAESVVAIGSMRPNPALFSNRCHTFLATGCSRVGELAQDDGEDLEVEAIPLVEVEHLVREGAIDHALMLAGLYLHRLS